MELTGVIFAVIVAASLMYLVPALLKQRAADVEEQPELPFGSRMRTIHVADQSHLIDENLFVSTPYIRRAQLREMRRYEARAAKRRRRALVGLVLVAGALVTTSALRLTPWWTLTIPAGLLVLFVAVARLTVRVMTRRHDARAVEISTGDDFTDTICFAAIKADEERHVELTGPIQFNGSLWDPVPVTVPTYVQKPLAPRTVRTIDLSAPEPASGKQDFPPTAERPVPVEKAPSEQLDPSEESVPLHLPRAVGE